MAIRVAPKAARNAISGKTTDELAIKVSVTAPPEDGKANAAVIKLLAKAWKLPKSGISVAKGATSRDKTLHVAGDTDTVLKQLEAWAEDAEDNV